MSAYQDHLVQRAEVAMAGDRRMRVTQHELDYIRAALPNPPENSGRAYFTDVAWANPLMGLDLIVVPECFRCVRPAEPGYLLCAHCRDQLPVHTVIVTREARAVAMAMVTWGGIMPGAWVDHIVWPKVASR